MKRNHAFLNGLIPFVALPLLLGGCDENILGPEVELTGEISYEEGDQSLKMTPKKAVLKPGESIRLKAEWEEADDPLIPYEGASRVFWESDNPGVATVDQDGIVLALHEGTAIITATSKEGRAQSEVAVIAS